MASTKHVLKLGRKHVSWDHSCHILPFQPILWNNYFPSEPAKPPKTAQHLFQRGVDYGRYGDLKQQDTVVQTANNMASRKKRRSCSRWLCVRNVPYSWYTCMSHKYSGYDTKHDWYYYIHCTCIDADRDTDPEEDADANIDTWLRDQGVGLLREASRGHRRAVRAERWWPQ